MDYDFGGMAQAVNQAYEDFELQYHHRPRGDDAKDCAMLTMMAASIYTDLRIIEADAEPVSGE